jgi:hypothetical protein
MPFIITRINVGDFDAWKPSFDKDLPRAREAATGYRLFRNLQDPGEVFVQVEFASSEDAQIAQDRLRSSGVLDRFSDTSGPTVVEEVETVKR